MWKVFSPFGVRFGPSSLWEGNRNAFGEERNTWAKGKSQWLDPPLPQNQKEKRRNDRSVTIITRPWENVAQTSSPPTGDWVKRKKKKKAPDIDPNHQHPVLGVSLGPHNHAGSYLKLPHFLVKSPPAPLFCPLLPPSSAEVIQHKPSCFMRLIFRSTSSEAPTLFVFIWSRVPKEMGTDCTIAVFRGTCASRWAGMSLSFSHKARLHLSFRSHVLSFFH